MKRQATDVYADLYIVATTPNEDVRHEAEVRLNKTDKKILIDGAAMVAGVFARMGIGRERH